MLVHEFHVVIERKVAVVLSNAHIHSAVMDHW